VAGRSTLTASQLAAAGISAVYTLSELEPDPERSMAQADLLLRQAGRAIARERLAEAVTGPREAGRGGDRPARGWPRR
jgi:hypothetical protein